MHALHSVQIVGEQLVVVHTVPDCTSIDCLVLFLKNKETARIPCCCAPYFSPQVWGNQQIVLLTSKPEKDPQILTCIDKNSKTVLWTCPLEPSINRGYISARGDTFYMLTDAHIIAIDLLTKNPNRIIWQTETL